MIIKHKLAALKKLIDSVHLADELHSLMLYSTARAIQKELDDNLEEIPLEDRPQETDHMRGRLAGFIAKFGSAVMPCEGDDISPEDWLARAKDDIMVVEGDATTGFD